MDHTHRAHAMGDERLPTPFPTDPEGLPEARVSQVLDLADGAVLELDVAPVAKSLAGTTVRMLAFNQSIPGPTLKVRQGTELVVHVVNHGDLDTTVHWHGLRLENRFDGVPHETQSPIAVGGDFTYRIQFPDPGLYWYHPHIREDYTQELGLYGNILVTPTDPTYWPPVDDEVMLTLDDLLLEDGRIAPFSPSVTTHAAMGRYGNVFLVAGQTQPELTTRAGHVVRFWLTNTANTRVFGLRLPGTTMKLVGGDSGRVEHEQLVSGVRLAPSERAVVDVRFDEPGAFRLEHHTPRGDAELATVTVSEQDSGSSRAAAVFPELRHDPELAALRRELPDWLARPPDKVVALVATIDDPATGDTGHDAVYRCPMHPEVTSDAPGRCPKCGMKLLHTGAESSPRPTRQAAEATPTDGPTAGIEWEDDMVEMNRQLTSERMHWRITDRTGGQADAEVDWHFTVGDRVKIRLVNEAVSDHPMHHPFHVHGAGRFVVLRRDNETEPNLVWKDTVLIPAGQTVDIMFDVTHPGRWMAHCHIAEHMQSGMMFAFDVGRADASTA